MVNNEKKEKNISIVYLTLLAALVGLLAGAIGVAFRIIIEKLSLFLFSPPIANSLTWQKLRLVLLPIVGSILLSINYRFLFKKSQSMGIGVADIFHELKYLDRLILKPQQSLKKVLNSIITLSFGLSAGVQSPMIYIGGVLGSNIAYRLNLDEKYIKILIACSVSGALSSTFGSILFASVFVMEVLLKNNRLILSFPIFISAITGAMTRHFLYSQDMFLLIQNELVFSFNDNYFYIIFFGILTSLVSLIYMASLQASNTLFKRLRLPYYIKPLFAGLTISLIGYFFPLIFDIYYKSVDTIVNNPSSILSLTNRPLLFIILLLFLKIIATSITLASGGMGGTFAPGLMIGGLVGIAYAYVFNEFFGLAFDYSSFALVGMAGVFSAFAWAPLSATLLIIELSSSKHFLPILLVCLISSIISQSIKSHNIYMICRDD